MMFEQPRLTGAPQLMPRETAQSYLGRLTGFYVCRTQKEFCKDFGLDVVGILYGQRDALQELAHLTGACLDQLDRWTPKRIDKSRMEIAGNVLSIRDNPRRQLRLCPLCAKEDATNNPDVPVDLAVYGRCEWMLGIVDVCASHQVRLVQRRANVRCTRESDITYETSLFLEDLHDLEIEPGELNAFERYALGRIGSLPQVYAELLDPLSLGAVANVCLALGSDILRAGSVFNGSQRQRWEAGFLALNSGHDGFTRALEKARGAPRLGVMASSTIPRLMLLLNKRPADLAGFANTMRPLLAKVFPYRSDDVLLGRSSSAHYLDTFPRVARKYGVPRGLLVAAVNNVPGLAIEPWSRPSQALIDVRKASQFFRNKAPYLLSAEVCRIIGSTPTGAIPRVRRWIKLGLLPLPMLDAPVLHFSAEDVRNHLRVLAKSLEAMGETPGWTSIHSLSAETGADLESFA
ncbi:MAG TPA: TniQ family protein [Devosia sp.]|jgi:hypothetical protein|nr:TniQ family protein [Devosia sp.]